MCLQKQMRGERIQSTLVLARNLRLSSIATLSPQGISPMLSWAKKADSATVFYGIVVLVLTILYRS